MPELRVTDTELRLAADLLLRRGDWGVSREDFHRHFGGDRRGRAIMAELRKRGILPVVVADSPAGDEVYKVAQSEEEFQAYRASLVSRIQELHEAVRGLDAAWAEWRRTGRPRFPQPTLFEVDRGGGG
ncbi:SusD/RagB family nutrient-binding outer membrane lipoprotein [Thermus sp. SYSU G05001]|uniref:SusD/RagB family nutrient-binding outer membrane lipoprotein n=1 Tax=Thermus brevis TaxID=2862456 RepID=A0ABS7A244_9DEIN|nr:SusD/RagB family nutrient-binding outer membrane lipoprotein [Thermus brevis]MBW6395254.1 SusD/RagB family nutrient-binding outer membrane lipoprotein [Thermus brevis]